MELKRRDLIKNSALVCGGIALAGLTGCANSSDSISANEEDLAASIKIIEDRLWVAEAKEAIRYKLSLYPRGLDRQDVELGKKAYAEDSYVDYGTSPDGSWSWQGTGWDWVEYCTNTIDRDGISANGGYYAHLIFNVAITVNGDKAGSEIYGSAPVLSTKQDGSHNLSMSIARYCDKWECRDGDWLIVERIVTSDYAWTLSPTGTREPYGGSFDKSDPSYEALAYGE